METTVKSKNPCPSCGKKEWVIWFLSAYDEWIPMYVELITNTKALVDLTGEESEAFDLIIKDSLLIGRYVDECTSCGAFVQG